MINKKRLVMSVGLWLLVFSGLVGFYFWNWLHHERPIADDLKVFSISKGESLYRVANRLHQQDMLRWPKVWRLYAQYKEKGTIKVGEYQFSDQESPLSILKKLQSGNVITYSITLVEGRRFDEWIERLALEPRLKHELSNKTLSEQMTLLNISVDHPEGWFFPDTYQFIRGDTDISIMRRAHVKMQQVLEREWNARQSKLPYNTPYEALIMASIIEKETGVPSERAEIAGVFKRRLDIGMRLQTDPTVIYGLLNNGFTGNLTRTHLRTPGPYNTYLNKGLPPTPIAMPSEEAIKAALNPQDGKTLYFVAKGDGSHYFSVTLEEHNRAVLEYQKKNRNQNYRSSPSVPLLNQDSVK